MRRFRYSMSPIIVYHLFSFSVHSALKMETNKKKVFMNYFGLVLLVAQSIVLLVTFGLAFFNPEKYIIVYIDRYNEGIFEFILLLVGIPLQIFFIINAYNWITDKWIDEEENK